MQSLSFSHYSLLRTCGEKYRLKVLEGRQEPMSHVFEFGTSLHAGLHALLDSQDLEQAQATFEAYWDSVKDKVSDYDRYGPEQLGSMGSKFLSNFYKKYGSNMKLIVAEKRLYSQWDDSVTPEGTPDALVEWGGQNVLLDYKSSAYAYQDVKTDVSLQLNLYAWLLTKNGYKVDSLCYFVFQKNSGCVQTPYLVPYSEEKALQLITPMIQWFKRNIGHYEKNATACAIYKEPCPFIKECFK